MVPHVRLLNFDEQNLTLGKLNKTFILSFVYSKEFDPSSG